MGYSSAQFIGRTAALKAFQNSNCTNWSVLQGKQFMFKYDGVDSGEAYNALSELLDMIANSSGSEAIYTLRVYDLDLPTAKSKVQKVKIYETTPYDGSFNFKLFDQENAGPGGASRYRENESLKKEISDLKLLYQEMIKKRNEEDDDEKSGISGMISGILEDPQMKAAIVGKVVQLFNGVTNHIGGYMDKSAGGQPAKIAGPSPEPIQMPSDKVQLLNSALTILAGLDPQLPEHLSKLAAIAQKDPATYNFLIGSLNNMK
jgi:hypothetical protein